MEFKDYYAALGVPKTATEKEIKQAYRKLARKWHPDVNPGNKSAESRFKDINEAYEVIGDPEKRRKYDELGSNWRYYEQQAAQGPPPGFEHYSWPTGGTYRNVSPEEMDELFSNDSPFSDFFQTFFGGAGETRRTRGRARAQQGSDLEHPVQLTLEEAFHGTTRRLSVQHAGKPRTFEVRIPAGVKDQARVRVGGEGQPGTGGGQAGDLYLRIQLVPHATFERHGNDLHTRVSVPVTTAVLGGEANVPSLSGKPVRLKIPATTQNGQRFRLKGQGMPVSGQSKERGDMYVTVEAQLPRTLTPKQREHYEALAGLESTT